MPTNSPEGVDAVVSLDDPRVDGEFLRTIPAADGGEPGVLVGVVHEHPASVYRVSTVTEHVDPDAVGLELPGIALPPFERLARDHAGEDSLPGDEMSAAIAASDDASVAGIDTLGRPFLRHFVEGARRENASFATLRQAASATAGVARNAVSRRFAARRRCGGTRGDGDARFEYAVTATDPPARQARDERRNVEKSRSLLGAIERPLAARLLDDARERTMASLLDDLREEGSVVAVVGIDHLDAISEALGGSTPTREG